MRKIAAVLLALAIVVGIAGASFAAAGKVAIVTNTVSQNEEEYRSAEEMIRKYGDRVVHVTWPDNFMTEQEQMVTILARLAADYDIKAIVINQAVPGSNAAVDKLKDTRDDIFIVYCNPQENPPDVAERAHIILQPYEIAMGETIPVQAKALGAKTFVHYSFPRHMSIPFLAQRRDLMREKCAELGIEFVDATAPDPTGDLGLPCAQQFILEDVPKMVERYGEDTAFFATNCGMQIPLITAVVDTKAIYPQPCCPSPYHGFPAALGIESDLQNPDNLQYVVDETRRILAEKGVSGRLSTWPVPIAMTFTAGSVEYAFKVIDGEISIDSFDKALLERYLSDYTETETTLSTAQIDDNTSVVVKMVKRTDVELTEYVDDAGVEYPSYLFTLIGFLTY